MQQQESSGGAPLNQQFAFHTSSSIWKYTLVTTSASAKPSSRTTFEKRLDNRFCDKESAIPFARHDAFLVQQRKRLIDGRSGNAQPVGKHLRSQARTHSHRVLSKRCKSPQANGRFRGF
jgi:hypothetical protein